MDPREEREFYRVKLAKIESQIAQLEHQKRTILSKLFSETEEAPKILKVSRESNKYILDNQIDKQAFAKSHLMFSSLFQLCPEEVVENFNLLTEEIKHIDFYIHTK